MKANHICSPSTNSRSAGTLSDAIKECSDNPDCGMFFYEVGRGLFWDCYGKTAYLYPVTFNAFGYRRQGNRLYAQFKGL